MATRVHPEIDSVSLLSRACHSLIIAIKHKSLSSLILKVSALNP